MEEIFEKKLRKLLMRMWIVCKKGSLLALLVLVCPTWGEAARTQEYPTRAITLLIANSAGGGVDVCARMIAQEAEKILGQEIIPVNRPGGGGAVGVGILANSKGDGYTLCAATDHPLTTIPHMESIPYDPTKDLIPIIQYGSLKSVYVVRSDSPHTSFKDLIEFARKNPGKVSFGAPGTGTSSHLFMEQVILSEKVSITIVPFQGAAPAMTALLGGHIQQSIKQKISPDRKSKANDGKCPPRLRAQDTKDDPRQDDRRNEISQNVQDDGVDT